LVAAWIAFEPALPASDKATGLYKALLDLNDVMRIGATAVAAFVASIAGAVLSTFTVMVVNWFLRSAWSQGLACWITEECQRMTPDEQHRLNESPRLHARVDALKASPSLNPFDYLPGGRERAVVRLRQSEWRQLRFRLLKQHPEIYTEIDRMESEAEFRFAIAIPVIALGIAAAERATTYQTLWGVGGTVIGLLLIRAAVAVSGATERTMVDLIEDRVVTLPVMDAIRDASAVSRDSLIRDDRNAL